MAKSVHPKKKRITHIANLSDSNFESDTGSVLFGCFDYVDSIMKEMDSGMKSVDCNTFYRQDVGATNPRAQNNEQNPVPYSNDSSQNLKNADSKFKRLTAARKFPLMEKSQKVLKQLKHNRSIPKQRAHLATIPASPVRKNSVWRTSELLQRKRNEKVDQKKRALPKITCSKNSSKSEVLQSCSVKHSGIQNKMKRNANNKSNVQHSGIKERAKVNAYSESNINSIDKKNHVSTHHKIDYCKIQPYSVQESLDSRFIEKTYPTKDDDTTDSEYERFVQNNKMEFHCETITKPKKKSVKKRKASKKKPKRTKEAELVICESEQYDSNSRDDSSHNYAENISKKRKSNYQITAKLLESTNDESETNLSVTKKKTRRAMQTESIYQSEQYETNCRDDSSDSDYVKNISNKRKNNYKMTKKSLESTNDESETNLSIPKRATETESIHQSEQYDSNCRDDSSDSDNAKNISNKQKRNSEITTKSLESTNDESEINLCMSKRITEKELQSEQYDSNCKDDSFDCVNLLKKQNKHKIVTKSLESTNDETGRNLSENSRISTKPEMVNFVDYQVGGNTIQNDCSALKENCLNMPYATESENLYPCTSDDIPIKHEDLMKQNSTHVTHSKDSAKVDAVNMELSTNNYFQNHLEEQKNINSASSDIFNQTVDFTNSVLIDLSSSDTETENVKSLASSATPIAENSKIVNLQNTATNSEDSDIEIIEVIPVPNRKEKVNTLVNVCDYLKNHSSVDSNKCLEIENTVKCSPEIKYSQTLVNTNDKHIKKENKVQNHSAVYKTNICKDELLNSIPGYCKSEDSYSKTGFSNSTVLYEDDIMIIDPVKSNESCQAQVKKEICDDDIIIDAVVYKCKNSDIKPVISAANSVSQNENLCTVIKKELSPMNMLNCSLSHLENLQKNISQSNRSESTDVQNMNCFKHLKSGIKNECSTTCPKSGIQNNSSLIEKELALFVEKSSNSTSSIEGILRNAALDNSAVLRLLDIYKREFNIYQDIVRTEENVEVGLKLVEAHQAERLKSIRSLIQKMVKSDKSFNNIYNESLLNSKEEKKKLHDTIKTSTPNRVQTPDCYSVDASKSSQISISQGLSTMVSQDVSPSCIQVIPCVSSKAVKMEVADEKPDVSKLISPQIQQTFKSEIGFMLNTSSTKTTYSDLQSEEKQEIKLFGKKCDVCGKEAVAACQGCAKAFFCSHKCGKMYWNDGHGNACGK